MKVISVFLLSVIICISFTSCQKDNTNSDAGNFSATVDSNQFVANKFSAAIAINVIAITGQSDDGRQIVLRVKDSGVHVYSLDINSLSNAGAYSINNDNAYTTNSGNTAAESGGTLSILSIDTSNKKITGTFSMKVYRQLDSKQISITKGSFSNIPYVTDAFPASKATDTLTVKVDGSPFAGYSITGISAYETLIYQLVTRLFPKSLVFHFRLALLRVHTHLPPLVIISDNIMSGLHRLWETQDQLPYLNTILPPKGSGVILIFMLPKYWELKKPN